MAEQRDRQSIDDETPGDQDIRENVDAKMLRGEYAPVDGLSERQTELAKEYLEYTLEYGPFNQGLGEGGAHYINETQNPFRSEGIMCARCVFYRQPMGCAVVNGLIAPGGVCKLWIIPEAQLMSDAKTITDTITAQAVEVKGGARHSRRDRDMLKSAKAKATEIVQHMVDLGADDDDEYDPPVTSKPDDGEEEVKDEVKRAFDPNTGGGVDRDKLDASDFVDPARRAFPIVTPADVADAVASWGRYTGELTFEEFKRALMRLCRRKGETFTAQLPQAWRDDAKSLSTDPDHVLVTFGGAVKALENGRVGGYLIVFGSPDQTDLENDFFTKETDFGIKSGDKTAVYFNHRLPLPTRDGRGISVKERIGDGTLTIDDYGVFIDAVLYSRERYEKMLSLMGWSSGTAPHLVDRVPMGKSYWVKSWPLGLDASLTPQPAEPRTRPATLKTILETLTPLDTGEPLTAGSRGDVTPVLDIALKEIITMADQTVNAVVSPAEASTDTSHVALKGLTDQVDALSKMVNQLVTHIQNEPAIRQSGYYTVDGGRKDKNIKSLGDFLLSIYRQDDVRLRDIYGSVKDVLENTGTSGGYLVPEEYSNRLLQVTMRENGIVSRVQRAPVDSPVGKYPALDQFATPTAGSGNTAFAAGVVATTRAEGASFTETQPTFEQLEWRVKSVGGYTEVSNELITDSPLAIETLLSMLFRISIAAKTERHILRGVGTTEPLGILNAPCLVNVTPNTNNAFTWVDVTTMYSRFFTVSANTVWLVHPSIWPDIGSMEVSTGSGGVFQANLQAGLGGNLLGIPVIQSEHLPQANNSGDVILADLGAYLLFERGGLSIAYSEHAAFTRGMGTWRFEQRLDGMPWFKNAITLADPQGSFTQSPFVNHND